MRGVKHVKLSTLSHKLLPPNITNSITLIDKTIMRTFQSDFTDLRNFDESRNSDDLAMIYQ